MDVPIMHTPRPTIEVEDLEDAKRYKCAMNYRDYDNGARFCFRRKSIVRTEWDWPWPRIYGLPDKHNISDWLDMIDEWKYEGNNSGELNDRVEYCISILLAYF